MSRHAILAVATAALVLAGCGGSGSTTGSHTRARLGSPPARRAVTVPPGGRRAVTVPPGGRTAVTVPPPPVVPRMLVGQIPDRLHTSQRVVALTFDAGADNAGAPKILAALARTGATATFFMTGRWADLYPQWARRIVAHYPIANHTFDHQDLLGMPLQSVGGELLRAAAAIKHATGRAPVPLFRFPYGSSNAAALAVVNHLGYTAVGWTVDTLGWEGTSMGQSVGSVFSRAIEHLEPGEIILMHVGANPHDHSTLDADALPRIIAAILARGYQLVTLQAYL